jgi:hypothetical protein
MAEVFIKNSLFGKHRACGFGVRLFLDRQLQSMVYPNSDVFH